MVLTTAAAVRYIERGLHQLQRVLKHVRSASAKPRSAHRFFHRSVLLGKNIALLANLASRHVTMIRVIDVVSVTRYFLWIDGPLITLIVVCAKNQIPASCQFFA